MPIGYQGPPVTEPLSSQMRGNNFIESSGGPGTMMGLGDPGGLTTITDPVMGISQPTVTTVTMPGQQLSPSALERTGGLSHPAGQTGGLYQASVTHTHDPNSGLLFVGGPRTGYVDPGGTWHGPPYVDPASIERLPWMVPGKIYGPLAGEGPETYTSGYVIPSPGIIGRSSGPYCNRGQCFAWPPVGGSQGRGTDPMVDPTRITIRDPMGNGPFELPIGPGPRRPVGRPTPNPVIHPPTLTPTPIPPIVPTPPGMVPRVMHFTKGGTVIGQTLAARKALPGHIYSARRAAILNAARAARFAPGGLIKGPGGMLLRRPTVGSASQANLGYFGGSLGFISVT